MARLELFHMIEQAKAENSIESDLNRQDLAKIPSEVFQFSNLQWLKFFRNQVTEIPDVIASPLYDKRHN
jgi:hypothetical protein